MIERKYIVERQTLAHEAFWLDESDARATVLVITGLGSRALASDTDKGLLRRRPDGRIDDGKLNFEVDSKVALTIGAQSPPQRKLDRVIEALETPAGATIAELAEVTSWQEKSVRAALSTQIPRRLELQIEVVRSEAGPARYRVQRRTDSR